MKREIKISIEDGQAEVKIDEVNGVRRKNVLHLKLTSKETWNLNQSVQSILYTINAGRSALSEDEFKALPQPDSKVSKDKTEIME